MNITIPPKPVTKPLTRVAVMALAVQRSGLTAQQIETTPAGRAAWIKAVGELARGN